MFMMGKISEMLLPFLLLFQMFGSPDGQNIMCMESDMTNRRLQLKCTVDQLIYNVDFMYPNNFGYAHCIAPTSLTKETGATCECKCSATPTCKCNITQNIETKTTILVFEDTELTKLNGSYICRHGSYSKSIKINNRCFIDKTCSDKCFDGDGNEFNFSKVWMIAAIVLITVVCLMCVIWYCDRQKLLTLSKRGHGVYNVDDAELNLMDKDQKTDAHDVQPEKSVCVDQQQSNGGHEQASERVVPKKRKRDLSFSQILCDTCAEVLVCTVCINCRKLYCKLCCEIHTESEKDHTILHIPHVSAGNQDIKCGKCKNKTSEQLCTICLNLMCESCAGSHVHEGYEGTKMMIIYHGHPKLLRQNSEEKLNFFQNLSIEKRGERYPIRICGISYIADGRLILVDKRNRNLLVFKSKEEKHRLHLGEEPHALTSMTGQHIAITFPFEMEIRIYKISENSIDKINIICLPSLKISNLKPYSIAFDHDFFVVEVGEGDDGKIIIMNDTQIHYEIPNKNCAYFTGNTIRLALEVSNQNPLEGRVFLSALSKNVVFCVDFQGNEIWKVSIPSPRGISVVPENCIPMNNLVICSRRCNTIFGLNKENGGDKQILLSEGKIKLPRYITCNNKDRLLCIQVGTEDGKEESVSCVEVRAPPSN